MKTEMKNKQKKRVYKTALRPILQVLPIIFILYLLMTSFGCIIKPKVVVNPIKENLALIFSTMVFPENWENYQALDELPSNIMTKVDSKASCFRKVEDVRLSENDIRDLYVVSSHIDLVHFIFSDGTNTTHVAMSSDDENENPDEEENPDEGENPTTSENNLVYCCSGKACKEGKCKTFKIHLSSQEVCELITCNNNCQSDAGCNQEGVPDPTDWCGYPTGRGN